MAAPASRYPMTTWQAWASYRRFQKLPPRDRSIVFYSETHQDWHHLQPLIDFLVERLSRTVYHARPDAKGVQAGLQDVPLPSVPQAGLHTFRIRPSVVCTWF